MPTLRSAALLLTGCLTAAAAVAGAATATTATGRSWSGLRRPRSRTRESDGDRSAALPRRRDPAYLRVKRGGAGGNYDDPYGNDDYYNDPYGGRGPPPQPAGWDDWDEPFDQQQQPPDYWPDNRQQQQQQPPSRKKGTKRRSGGGLEVGGVDLGSVVTKGHKTWGGMCIAAGVLLTGMGISLFFNKFLIRLGNLALVLGVSLLIGPSRCVKYFTHPTKLRGTIIFALGFFLVFTGHPILGIAAEVFGFLNLFGNMLPLLTMMARQLPVVGDLIPQPGTGGGGSKRGKPKRRPPPPPPPQDDWFDGDYGDYGGDDGYQQQPYRDGGY